MEVIVLQKLEDTAHGLLLSVLSLKPFWFLILCGWPAWLSFVLDSESLQNVPFEPFALQYHSDVPWWGCIFINYGGYLKVEGPLGILLDYFMATFLPSIVCVLFLELLVIRHCPLIFSIFPLLFSIAFFPEGFTRLYLIFFYRVFNFWYHVFNFWELFNITWMFLFIELFHKCSTLSLWGYCEFLFPTVIFFLFLRVLLFLVVSFLSLFLFYGCIFFLIKGY